MSVEHVKSQITMPGAHLCQREIHALEILVRVHDAAHKRVPAHIHWMARRRREARRPVIGRQSFERAGIIHVDVHMPEHRHVQK
jgi:hypothetical protein